MADLVETLRDCALYRSEELFDQSADRIEKLEEALGQLVRLYAKRGGEADALLPVDEQEPEMAAAIQLL